MAAKKLKIHENFTELLPATRYKLTACHAVAAQRVEGPRTTTSSRRSRVARRQIDSRPAWYCHKKAQNSQRKSRKARVRRREFTSANFRRRHGFCYQSPAASQPFFCVFLCFFAAIPLRGKCSTLDARLWTLDRFGIATKMLKIHKKVERRASSVKSYQLSVLGLRPYLPAPWPVNCACTSLGRAPSSRLQAFFFAFFCAFLRLFLFASIPSSNASCGVSTTPPQSVGKTRRFFREFFGCAGYPAFDPRGN